MSGARPWVPLELPCSSGSERDPCHLLPWYLQGPSEPLEPCRAQGLCKSPGVVRAQSPTPNSLLYYPLYVSLHLCSSPSRGACHTCPCPFRHTHSRFPQIWCHQVPVGRDHGLSLSPLPTQGWAQGRGGSSGNELQAKRKPSTSLCSSLTHPGQLTWCHL